MMLHLIRVQVHPDHLTVREIYTAYYGKKTKFINF